jgi:hypothetical protein
VYDLYPIMPDDYIPTGGTTAGLPEGGTNQSSPDILFFDISAFQSVRSGPVRNVVAVLQLCLDCLKTGRQLPDRRFQRLRNLGDVL